MQINYLEAIFRFYTADYIFSVSMATQITLQQSHLKISLTVWLVFSKASGQTVFDSLGIYGKFTSKVRGNPLKFHLIQCLNTRYGFHKTFDIFSPLSDLSNLLACGTRISSWLLSFPCASFSNLNENWPVLRALSGRFEKIAQVVLSSLSWYWIEEYSLHKTELNYRSLDRRGW